MKGATLLALLGAAAFADEPQMRFLENDRVKVGVDLRVGGAITWLSRDGGGNLVNNFDHGRQVQLSFYSGPVPFEAEGQKPSEHWRHLGWNPIQAGDDFGHGSRIVEERCDGRTIYVKCVPLQWPLNNVPGECTFESWLELDGSVVKGRARLNNARSDKTQYAARDQELPAVYANAPYYRVVSYTGERPFTGDSVSVIPKPQGKHPWAFWIGTEQWSALLDDKDNGIGLITPGRIRFTGGFAGKPGPNDTRASSTGYLASPAQEILDHNIVFEYRYELLPGSLDEIRARAKANAAALKTLPSWKFEHDRQGWRIANAQDSGWPISGMLDVSLSSNDPHLTSPYAFWKAEDAPFLIIEAAFKTHHSTATVFWTRHTKSDPQAVNSADFPIQGDGTFLRYVVRLGQSKSYTGAMIGLRIDPAPDGREGESVRIKSIALSLSE